MLVIIIIFFPQFNVLTINFFTDVILHLCVRWCADVQYTRGVGNNGSWRQRGSVYKVAGKEPFQTTLVGCHTGWTYQCSRSAVGRLRSSLQMAVGNPTDGCSSRRHVSTLFVIIICTASQKKEPIFFDVCIFLVLLRNWRIFFTNIRPQESRFISYNFVTQSAHLWWPAVAKLQAASVRIA